MARDTWECLQGGQGKRKKIEISLQFIMIFQKLNIFKHDSSSVFKRQYNQNVLIGESKEEPR